MKDQKHEFPTGITEEVLREICQETGREFKNYDDRPINEDFRIAALSYIEFEHVEGRDEPIRRLESAVIFIESFGVGKCPTWLYKELVERGLAPEIRKPETDVDLVEKANKFINTVDALRNHLQENYGVEIKEADYFQLNNIAYAALHEQESRLLLLSQPKRSIDTLTEEEWKSVLFSYSKIKNKSDFEIEFGNDDDTRPKYINIVGNDPETGYSEVSASFHYDIEKGRYYFESECCDVDVFAAIKRLEELGVDLNKKQH